MKKYMVYMSLFIFLLAVPVCLFAQDDELTGFWRFDETSGTTAADSSVNGQTGILENGPEWTTGYIDGALSFDGIDDYVETGNSTFDINSELIVSMWINIAESTSSRQIMIQKGAYAYPFMLRLESNNRIGTMIRTDDTYDFTSNAVLTLEDWHHVALTDEEEIGSIYINGDTDSNTVITGDLFVTTSYDTTI